MKRAFDIAVASGAMIVTLPALSLAAAAILALDGAPVLFIQDRVGQERRPFRIYKLRTMRDGQVTPVGRLLRATGLDELPQLINVLIGDMSLVGPRPLTDSDIRRLGWDAPRYDRRFAVRPGITGLAQLQLSRYCDARISWVCDRYYVERATLATDVRVLATSALYLLLGKQTAQALVQRQRRARARRRR